MNSDQLRIGYHIRIANLDEIVLIDTDKKLQLARAYNDWTFGTERDRAEIALLEECGVTVPTWMHERLVPRYTMREEETLP